MLLQGEQEGGEWEDSAILCFSRADGAKQRPPKRLKVARQLFSMSNKLDIHPKMYIVMLKPIYIRYKVSPVCPAGTCMAGKCLCVDSFENYMELTRPKPTMTQTRTEVCPERVASTPMCK